MDGGSFDTRPVRKLWFLLKATEQWGCVDFSDESKFNL